MQAPVFVKIEDYKDVLDTIGLVKDKINQAKETIAKIHELKTKEDEELANWDRTLEEVGSKVEEIDHNLFEPETV